MDELSHHRNEISDLTAILSLVTQAAPPDLEENSDRQHFEDCAIDPGTEDERINEAEFDTSFASGNEKVNAMKEAALDRLAEVLARFKTAKGPRVRNKHQLDAKHVTSVIMVEELGESVTFLCAKNEGLDSVDLGFLAKLEGLLRNAAPNGKRSSS